jgi:membrane protease subunit (stomatin/prohibitin family)
MKDGRIADVFAPGRYKLTTANLPVLTSLMNWAKGFNSPFKCDVYYVSTTQFTGQKWGTSNPFTMRDKDFGIIRVRGFGNFSYRVKDAKLFMQEISGSLREYSTEKINEHLRSIIISKISDVIADSKYSAIDLASKLTQFNAVARTALEHHFTPIGMELTSFVFENISFPEEIERAIDKRGAVGIMGDVLQSHLAMEKVGAMRDAANNQGMTGAMFGMGVAGGLGGAMQGGVGGILNNTQQTQQQSPAAAGGTRKFCCQCGNQLGANARFCSGCGAQQS